MVVTVVTIDYRETRLSAIYKGEFVRENMDVGDVLISSTDVEILLERKTISDLLSSVKDGRYRDQKARMQAWKDMSHDKERIIAYVIEGPFKYGDAISTGCLLNSAFRDHIHVLRVTDVTETATLLLEIASRVDSFKSINKSNNSANKSISISNNIHTRRRDNLGGPRECLVRQLCQIDGVSERRAELIVGASGAENMSEFVEWARQWPTKIPTIGTKLVDAIKSAIGV